MTGESLKIVKLSEEFFTDFCNGTTDRNLRVMYGLPEKTDENTTAKLFCHFCSLEFSYSIVDSGNRMVGFLLDVPVELPKEMSASVGGTGRTLAFAVFPSFQRKGCMEQVLKTYIPALFEKGIDYVHCGHFDFNIPCENLLIKSGFTVIGEHLFKDRIIKDMIKQKNHESRIKRFIGLLLHQTREFQNMEFCWRKEK